MSHIVLTGFMASGKTAVGRRLAKRLGYDFVDTDEIIEGKVGMPISDFFAQYGEAAFRRVEHEVVSSLAPERATVIATGGGTFVQADNREPLRRLGPVVCLVTSLETALERVGRNGRRPLAGGDDKTAKLGRLLEERRPHYRTADVMVETDGLTVDQAAVRVATAIAPRLRQEGGDRGRRRPGTPISPTQVPRPEKQAADTDASAEGAEAGKARRGRQRPRRSRRSGSLRFGSRPTGEDARRPGRGATAPDVVRVDLGPRAYDCLVRTGSLADGMARIAELEASSIFVVTNSTVLPLYGEAVESALRASAAAPERIHIVEIPDGERYKTMDTVESIYDRVLEAGIDRRGVLVALGGGVVGDLTGFVAATLLRGLRFAMIPTTLLAQVDSSVGGKTGIDRPHGKNLVGAFHQPSLVVIDPQTLATLPEREYLAGLAEVVKYGVILDRALFERIEAEAEAVLARDPVVMTPIIARCVRIKADVVEKDEFETTGLRRILNFGHTVGHALEQVTGYDRYLHGEAVAIGMAVAARLSVRRGLCPAEVAERLESLLSRLGLEHRVPEGLDPRALARAIALDKKAERSAVAYVLCERLGRCRAERLGVEEITGATVQ